jgi:hypothetical protein
VVACSGLTCAGYFSCVHACDGVCSDQCLEQTGDDGVKHVSSAKWCAGLSCKKMGRCVLDWSATTDFADPLGAPRGQCAACMRDALSTLTGDSCADGGDACNPAMCAAPFAACRAPDLGAVDAASADDAAIVDAASD